LVVTDDIQSYTKTKQASDFLKRVKAFEDVLKVINTKRNRIGKGKARNRRKVVRKGPLIVVAKNNGVVRAFKNIPGVDVADISRLNLLQLAPGGQVGRFVIWTESAFKELQTMYGSYANIGDSKLKKRSKEVYCLPSPMMINTDLEFIQNSEEVQKVCKLWIGNKHHERKKNPLKKFFLLWLN